MKSFDFKLVTPENILLEGEVDMVVIPGVDGNIGVLENHAPIITSLKPGLITVYKDNEIQTKVFVDGGVAEVTPTRCTALVTEGTPIGDLDKKSLEVDIKNLMEDVADAQGADEENDINQNLDLARTKMMEIISHEQTLR